MRRTLMVVCLSAALVGTCWQQSAFAGNHSDGWTDNGSIGAEAGQDGGSGSTPTTSHGGGAVDPNAPTCTYTPTNADALGPNGQAGNWYSRYCTYPDGVVSVVDVFVAAPVSPAQVAQTALQRVDLPTPGLHLNPAQDRVQLVNLSTWLAIDPADWKTTTASATAGDVTATTTATPSRVIWNMGDGNTVTCSGPGAIYDSSRSDSDQHSDCTYTYTKSSAGQPNNAFSATVTEEWHVTWTAVGGAAANGDLGIVQRSVTVPIRVGEVQTLNEKD